MPKGKNPGAVNNDALMHDLAVNIITAEQAMVDAKEYIKLLQDAGEDISQPLKDLTQQKVRVDNWKRTLKARGVDVEKIRAELEAE